MQRVWCNNVLTSKFPYVGLDPAGPGFKEAPEYARLDPGDAKIIDSIHTSSQVLALTHPVGHVDFYPNGGKAQPGCPDLLTNPSKSFVLQKTLSSFSILVEQ